MKEQLAAVGLSQEEIAHAYEMIEFSLNRALVETTGGIHTADYDDDPIFQASLKRARERFPPTPAARRQKWIIRAATTIAILIGLFALALVAYYALSLFLIKR